MAHDPDGDDAVARIGSGPPGEDVDAALVDLTDLTLSQVERLGRSSLHLALKRVLAPQDESSDPVLGFQSGI